MTVSHQGVYVQTPNLGVVQILPADTTTKKTIYTGGANGSKVVGLNAASTDSTARTIQIWVTRSGTSYLLNSVTVPVTSGADGVTAPTNMLGTSSMPVDNDGQHYIFLNSGDLLQGNTTIAITTAKEVDLICVARGLLMFTNAGTRAGRSIYGLLTVWIQKLFTANPNNTTPVAAWLPNNASANVDVAIVPKGTGSFLVNVPDNTATGGNKRGTNAFDGQSFRFSNTSVASGTGAVALGIDHTAGGNFSVCIGGGSGGAGNFASAINSAVIGGNGAGIASGATSAAILGGAGGAIAAGGQRSIILAGLNNATSGIYGVASGNGCSVDAEGGFSHGQQARSLGSLYSYSHGQAVFVSAGDNQLQRWLAGVITTTATPAQMSNGQNSLASSTVPAFVTSSRCLTITGKINALVPGGATCSGWTFSCVLRRVGVANATLVAACTPVLVAQDAGAAAWVVAITADASNQGLNITVTGAAATTIHWNAVVEAMQAG